MATTIINPPQSNDSSNSSGNGLGIIILLVVVVILVVYLFPMVINSVSTTSSAPQINVPKDVNVNVKSSK